MASQGPLYPASGTGVDPGGRSNPWSNPGYVTAYDSALANVYVAPTSNYLEATSFGFSVPGGNTILGIQADVNVFIAGTEYPHTQDVLTLKAGVAGGTNNATGTNLSTTADTFVTFGSASDLWGRAWTPADINAAGFGIAFAVTSASPAAAVAYVDTIRVTVTYTPTVAGAVRNPRMII